MEKLQEVETIIKSKFNNFNASLANKTFIIPSLVALIEKFSMHPLDTIITFQQKENFSFIKSIQHIFQKHGLRGYYKGLSYPLILSAPPGIIIVYGSYEGSKEIFSQYKLDKLENTLISSQLTGLLASVVATPLEAKRIRDTFEVKILKPNNLFTYYYRGFLPNTIKMCLHAAIALAGTDAFKYKLNKLGEDSGQEMIRNLSNFNNAYTSFLGGLLFGGLAQVITTPIDFIKTKIMSDYQSGTERKSLSFWQHTSAAYREKQLFTALGSRTLRLGLHTSVVLGCMSALNQILTNKVETKNTQDGAEHVIQKRA
jgi:hypothetical protein